jgi:hypothetical protein
MAEQLKPINIGAPGFYGLNTQDSPTALEAGYALTAENCVIDSYGRIGSRKGWQAVNAVNATLATNPITCLHEYVKNDGSTVQISIGNKNVFTGTSTLTSVYTDATWTGTNWKAVSFNNKAYFFQRGHDPLYYDGTTFAKLSAHVGYAGTVPLANEVLSAYGRLWVADTTTDKTTVKFSDTLQGHVWTGGSSGSVDLHNVFTNGTDSVVALAAFNGFLVILCKNCIIIYQGAKDPATMSLYDIIDGVGCVARDSVEDIGTDLVFLSSRGLQSLSRIVQEKSAPISNLSRNVQDQLLLEMSQATTLDTVKSAYYPRESMYLLTLPELDKVYCFDLRSKLENGALRTTTWSGQTPTAFCSTRSGFLYMGKPGYIGKYTGYLDNGATYTMNYATGHLDAGSIAVLKFLKKLGVVFVGGSGASVRYKWVLDYSYQSVSNINSSTLPAAAEYNLSEYGIAEYNTGIINRLIQTIGGQGKVFQIGVEVLVNNGGISIQSMDVFFKTGKEI